jgi:hypothetical protein
LFVLCGLRAQELFALRLLHHAEVTVIEGDSYRVRNSYFLPVIAELQQQPLPDGYLEYLRLKLRKLSQG